MKETRQKEIRQKAYETYRKLPDLMQLMSIYCHLYNPMVKEVSKKEIMSKLEDLNNAIDAIMPFHSEEAKTIFERLS
jgi:hypothetical protein